MEDKKQLIDQEIQTKERYDPNGELCGRPDCHKEHHGRCPDCGSEHCGRGLELREVK